MFYMLQSVALRCDRGPGLAVGSDGDLGNGRRQESH